ncbi:MAG: prolipoprotein diacylglyceryl transferase [Magnetococcales bacterium]|nr:prolipoprotein diacylglyceryl transferase [Magnetococcales bacterium]
MIAFPQIDPILVQVGPLAVRWYGVMYSLTFLGGWFLLLRRARRFQPHLHPDLLGDLLVWIILGVILGGRLGYILFYQPAFYLEHPGNIFHIWEGGMSFHGGLLGVVTAIVGFSWRRGIPPLVIGDLVAPISPLGLLLGRIGNFINGELWGRASDVPWAMVFPGAVPPVPRHPSQLYEAFLEGILLFALLWWVGRKARPPGVLLGLFLSGYGLARYAVEYFREPDAHLGLLNLGLSMGQWLSLPMIFAGLILAVWAWRKGEGPR